MSLMDVMAMGRVRWLRGVAAAAIGCVLALLAGCAPMPGLAPTQAPPQSSSPAPAAHPHPAGSAAAVPAPADTTPSSDALAVLATIPEPLPPDQRVPAPSEEAAVDTALTDTTAADVPIPSPTQMLGERRVIPTVDTTTTAPPSQPQPQPENPAPPAATPTTGTPAAPSPQQSAPPATASPPASAARPTGSECWRVQLAAPLVKSEATQVRDAASSLLLVDVVIEYQGKRYKVRTQECLTRDAAELLRKRAVASGFTQAFRISGR